MKALNKGFFGKCVLISALLLYTVFSIGLFKDANAGLNPGVKPFAKCNEHFIPITENECAIDLTMYSPSTFIYNPGTYETCQNVTITWSHENNYLDYDKMTSFKMEFRFDIFYNPADSTVEGDILSNLIYIFPGKNCNQGSPKEVGLAIPQLGTVYFQGSHRQSIPIQVSKVTGTRSYAFSFIRIVPIPMSASKFGDTYLYFDIMGYTRESRP